MSLGDVLFWAGMLVSLPFMLPVFIFDVITTALGKSSGPGGAQLGIAICLSMMLAVPCYALLAYYCWAYFGILACIAGLGLVAAWWDA